MNLTRTSKLILIGYLFIALFILINIQSTAHHDNNLESHYQKMLTSEKQVHLIQQLQLHAKNRSVLLVRIIFEKDAFAQDDYIQQTYIEGFNFVQTRQALLRTDLSEKQKYLLNEVHKITSENRSRQEKVIALIQAGEEQAAHEMLLQTVPVQNKVVKSLSNLSHQLQATAQQARASYQTIVKQSDLLETLLQSSLLIIVIIVGIFSYNQIRRSENIQQKTVYKLTRKMQNQAYENAMDAHILHAVDEYVVLVDDHGRFIRANPRMNNILEETHFLDVHTIWQLLEEASNQQIEISRAQQALMDKKSWQKELFLLSPFECFALCEIHDFHSEEIPNARYLLTIKDITELKETQEAVELQANFDSVTELPNRHFFQKTLTELTTQNNKLAVCYIDLDDFKNVNDTLGHDYGDGLLNAVSRRMYNLLLSDFIHDFHLARIGGDEFAIILTLPEQQQHEFCQQFGHKLIEVVSKPYNVYKQNLVIGCSIGVALYPQHGTDATKLMRHADLAMYEAKHSGKNQCALFNNTIGQKLEQKLILKNRIEQALVNHEFILHYQPQYNLHSNQLIGLEALIRWEHDDYCYSPNEFIPFAEKHGFIQLIDEYVLEMACQQIAEWQEQGLEVPRVAVNISSQQINSRKLVDIINRQLERCQFSGNLIELEITEYSLVKSLEKNHKETNWLNELKQKGIQIAIDDFGTGYSSLSYLQHMPIDRLKIDQSFVRNLNTETETHSIISSIISLGHNVNATVLAEGIETEQQKDILKQLGCDDGQGYLMNMPISAKQVTEILSEGKTLLAAS
ncbi:EAL domain-containing protein [Thiomicrorhabdus sediminis]|uniref:EAL domain-containing protein n=1 Tax=Thiomicrorhabdus sediminis TaxID=2580412 RepID=A0A4P9K746_9GAMM|nr:EAL domain-containing protein [Thiomicrorhabdus sediminis]QCU90849.1 EAL domain-containing protein [Thiomicrorhabdus sediminis]